MDIWSIIRKCNRAVKIAVGSSTAIYAAQRLGLDYATSAGTITLLTIVATKWETVRLSAYRIVSFVITALLASVVFHLVDQEWIAYGLFIFLVVFLCDLMGWAAVISVNAVVGIHFLSEDDFTAEFILNEFYLIVIGVTIAVILNLFHGNTAHKNIIIRKMRFVEEEMQKIMTELAAYLLDDGTAKEVWEDIRELERKLSSYVALAFEYQENTFHSHPGYYIDYFEMRRNQLMILQNLNEETRKIRQMPLQAGIIAEYILYLKDYVIELNPPEPQIGRLEKLFADMRQENLPATREEFENRAILYHVLMDLEDFLLCKQRFVEALTDKQKRLYWEKNR